MKKKIDVNKLENENSGQIPSNSNGLTKVWLTVNIKVLSMDYPLILDKT